MIFYEIDNALQEAITVANKPVRIKIEFDVAGHFESVFEQDIIEANFYGLKEAAGGTTARGEIVINNEKLGMRNEGGWGWERGTRFLLDGGRFAVFPKIQILHRR